MAASLPDAQGSTPGKCKETPRTQRRGIRGRGPKGRNRFWPLGLEAEWRAAGGRGGGSFRVACGLAVTGARARLQQCVREHHQANARPHPTALVFVNTLKTAPALPPGGDAAPAGSSSAPSGGGSQALARDAGAQPGINSARSVWPGGLRPWQREGKAFEPNIMTEFPMSLLRGRQGRGGPEGQALPKGLFHSLKQNKPPPVGSIPVDSSVWFGRR